MYERIKVLIKYEEFVYTQITNKFERKTRFFQAWINFKLKKFSIKSSSTFFFKRAIIIHQVPCTTWWMCIYLWMLVYIFTLKLNCVDFFFIVYSMNEWYESIQRGHVWWIEKARIAFKYIEVFFFFKLKKWKI